MKNYTTRITRIHILPEAEPLFSERATAIEIDSEGEGEFVKVSQAGGSTDYEKFILIDPDEWGEIRRGVDKMITECRGKKATRDDYEELRGDE